MCNVKENVEQKTAYQTSNRREYGIITSVDITLKLMKEFLEARQLVEYGPVFLTDDDDINKTNKEMYEKRVKPFFDHMSEIIDTL